MIEAGETGGILDIILQRLATYVEKAVRLRSAVKSALIYPVPVVSMAMLDRRRAAEVGRADLRQPVRRTGRRPAAAHAHRHGTERVRADISGGSSSWASLAVVFGIKQIRKNPQRPLLLRQDAAEAAGDWNAAAQDRGGALHPYSGYLDHFGRADSRRLGHHRHAPRAMPCWKKR